jgi:hypothetical protein
MLPTPPLPLWRASPPNGRPESDQKLIQDDARKKNCQINQIDLMDWWARARGCQAASQKAQAPPKRS